MLGVDEGDHATHGLRLGQYLERERSLARGLGSIDLDDATSRDPPDAKSGIKRDGARRYGLDLEARTLIAKAHDGTCAEPLVDLRRGGLDHLVTLFSECLLVDLTCRALALCHSLSLS